MKIIDVSIKALSFVLSFLLLVSCSSGTGNDRTGDGGININADYMIICSVSATTEEISAANSYKDVVYKATGIELPIVSDDTAPGEYEIIIGETARPETAQAKQKLGDRRYIITSSGKKITIYAALGSDYVYAVSYLKHNGVSEDSVKYGSDFCYISDVMTVFACDGQTQGKMKVSAGIIPYSGKTVAGLFVGKEKQGTVFGYSGYCILLKGKKLTLYQMDESLTEMASCETDAVKEGIRTDLMLVIGQTTLGAYILDDAEGVEPWPEFELKTERTTGSTVGFIELSGYGAEYSDLILTPAESADPGNKYTNALYAGYADPDVIKHDGVYYLYGTSSKGFRVHTSVDLVNWKDCGVCVSPDLWGRTTGYWAPDVEYIDGKFYMAVTCDLCVGIAVSDSPLGPFKEYSADVLYTNACDGNIFVDDDGTVYLYYVTGMGGANYGIYGVKLDKKLNPVASTRKILIKHTEDWERHDGNVTEGPFMLKHNGVYYLTYSGSHYKSIDYAVGYATSDSPLGVYKKYDKNPIMVGNSQIHGTGHHCIVESPDGSEMFIVYHCHNSLTQVQTRKICIDRIRFSPSKGKIDRLEVYGPTVTPQPYPR